MYSLSSLPLCATPSCIPNNNNQCFLFKKTKPKIRNKAKQREDPIPLRKMYLTKKETGLRRVSSSETVIIFKKDAICPLRLWFIPFFSFFLSNSGPNHGRLISLRGHAACTDATGDYHDYVAFKLKRPPWPFIIHRLANPLPPIFSFYHSLHPSKLITSSPSSLLASTLPCLQIP